MSWGQPCHEKASRRAKVVVWVRQVIQATTGRPFRLWLLGLDCGDKTLVHVLDGATGESWPQRHDGSCAPPGRPPLRRRYGRYDFHFEVLGDPDDPTFPGEAKYATAYYGPILASFDAASAVLIDEGAVPRVDLVGIR